MAHFARVDDSGVVQEVICIPNGISDPQSYITEHLGLAGMWLQTSYNSRGGKHYYPNSNVTDEKPHFRFNYAGPGYTFDPSLGPDGAFVPPAPQVPPSEGSVVLDLATCLWHVVSNGEEV